MRPYVGRRTVFPQLAKCLRRGVLQEGLRGLSLWAAIAAAAWGVGNALFILLSPPWWATPAFGLILLSLAPAFFFTATDDSSLLRTLRSLDEGTAIEAALSPCESPASGLVTERAKKIDESIPFKVRTRSNPFRGMAGFWLAALACFVAFELMALVVFHRPVIAYHPRDSAAGSGLANIDSGALRPSLAKDKPEDGEDENRTETRKENLPAVGRTALSQEEIQAAFDNLAQTREERLARAEGGSVPDSGTGEKARDQNPGTQKKKDAEGNGGGSGEPGPENTDSRNKGQNARGQGYEGSDAGLPPSPLIDYRARLFQALTERGGQGVTVGESIDMAALRDYQRRFFGSFALEAPVTLREDVYSAMLKLRWRNLSGAFQ